MMRKTVENCKCAQLPVVVRGKQGGGSLPAVEPTDRMSSICLLELDKSLGPIFLLLSLLVSRIPWLVVTRSFRGGYQMLLSSHDFWQVQRAGSTGDEETNPDCIRTKLVNFRIKLRIKLQE
jgi:hypothetical protein